MKSWCLLLLAWTSMPVAAAEYTLGPPERLVLQYTFASHVAIGDFNGDGRDDLATAVWQVPDTNLHVFLQRTDGKLAAPLILALPDAANAESGYGLAVIDVEGDGIDEIAAGVTLPGVAIIRYDGTSILARQHVDGPGNCEYLASADIDGDGHADIACHDEQLTASFLYGDGAGGFVARKMRTTFGTYLWGPLTFKGIRLADVTGDGRLDFVGTDAAINSLFVYENNGRRGFLPARAYPQPWSGVATWAPTVADIDLGGDGTRELVTASPGNGAYAQLNIHRRQPNGFLQRTARVATHHSPTALQVADLDGDGLEDLVVGHFGFNAASVVLQREGTLVHAMDFELPAFRSHAQSLAVGDLDSDGCLDLAAGTNSGVFLLRGCHPPKRSVPRYDVDGDGLADLILARHESVSAALIWPFASERAWWTDPDHLQVPYFTDGSEVQAWGDFDGDGASDLFLRDRTTGENNFALTARRRADADDVPDLTWQVQGAGDFDGDDKSDLLWRNTATGANEIWPAGRGEDRYEISRLADRRWTLAGVGDFDADGRADLLWRHAGGQNMIWYQGRKALQKTLRSLGTAWAVAGIGDLDGDEADDIIWRNAALGRNSAWRGANASQTIVIQLRDASWTLPVVADYNDDGSDDLLWFRETGDMEIWRSGNANAVTPVSSVYPDWWVVR